MEKTAKDDQNEEGGGVGRYAAVAAGALLALGGGAFYFLTRTDRGFRMFLDRTYRNNFPDVALIQPEELAAKLAGDDPPALLDTRAPGEYAVSHLEGARLVDPHTFSQANLIGLKKDSEIVVYCSVGHRSAHIAELLADMGYRNVRNLYGGIFLWHNQGRPVYDSRGKVNRIHTYDRKWGRFVRGGEKIYD